MRRKDFKPDFICVGPHKTGTGWLYETLNRHKQIYPIDEKEIRYYSKLDFKYRNPGKVYLERLKRPVKWLTYGRFKLFWKYPFLYRTKGNYKAWWDFLQFELHFLFWPTSLTWYRRLFNGPDHLVKGDISPSYATMDIHTIKQIKDDFPNVKIIYFLREPVDRIWSHTKMLLAVKHLAPTQENIAKMMNLHAENILYQDYPFRTLKRWLEVFGSESVFIGFYEDLIADPVQYYRSICIFLGIESELDKAIRLTIPPYRIGHLFQAPRIFQRPDDVLLHKWKSSKMNIDIPKEVQKTLVGRYRQQVVHLDKMIPNGYPAQWIAKYDQILLQDPAHS